MWGAVRKTLQAAGFSLHQNGDAEGSLLFNPEDPEQSKLAISVMGARRKRRMTPEAREKAIAHLLSVRVVLENPAVEGHLTA